MKKFFTLILAFCGMTFGFDSWAGEDSDTTRIIIPIDITNPPVKKPMSPSYLKLTAYCNASGVVVMSNVDVMAEVKIYDEESGQSYYNATVALAPECHCPLPQVDAVLTLRIIIDDRTYKGMFQR